MDKTVRKALVVREDRRRDVLLEILLSEGFGDEVKFVTNGEEALLQAEQDQPDLIFVHLSTSGLDAVDLTKRFKANPVLAHIPVVVYGALPPERIYGSIKIAGAAGYLLQPFGIRAFTQARDAALNHLTYFP